VICLETSVAIAHLLAEDRRPPDRLWAQPLVASRLVEHELWTRLNARGLPGSHGDAARRLVERLALMELLPNVLGRAKEPFPAPVRTLDALHLASILFLRERAPAIELASYDDRLLAAARALGIRTAPL
jgi:hypothetical protein